MEHLGLTGFCSDLRIKGMNESRESQARAFVAISLPDHVRQALEQLQAGVRSQGINASWTKPENLHLTLKFLGNILVQDMEPIISAMNQTIAGFSKFELDTGGLGVFPSVKKARVLWAGIGGRTDILESLWNSLESSLEVLGIKKQEHRFFPHITLGRIKRPIPPVELISLINECKDIRSRSFEPAGLDLFKSKLSPFGARYTRLFQAKINSG
jgi:2'-5' RNA ligase